MIFNVEMVQVLFWRQQGSHYEKDKFCFSFGDRIIDYIVTPSNDLLKIHKKVPKLGDQKGSGGGGMDYTGDQD